MPLHPDPTNIAEELARHLEMNYALQLDPARHKHLVAELAAYGDRFVANSNIVLVPHTPGAIADLEKGTEVIPDAQEYLDADAVVAALEHYFPKDKSNAK